MCPGDDLDTVEMKKEVLHQPGMEFLSYILLLKICLFFLSVTTLNAYNYISSKNTYFSFMCFQPEWVWEVANIKAQILAGADADHILYFILT
jgi:hypothetical protein